MNVEMLQFCQLPLRHRVRERVEAMDGNVIEHNEQFTELRQAAFDARVGKGSKTNVSDLVFSDVQLLETWQTAFGTRVGEGCEADVVDLGIT